MRREERVRRAAAEAVRALGEQIRVASDAVRSVDERIAFTDEKLEVIETLIKEAGSMYQVARLEYQDYLQHWAFYEEARLERLALSRERWLAQAVLISVLGPLPDSCEAE